MRSFQELRAELDRLEAKLDAGDEVAAEELAALEDDTLRCALPSKESLPVPRVARLMARAGRRELAIALMQKALAGPNAGGALALQLANMLAERAEFSAALAALTPFLGGERRSAAMLGRAADFHNRLGNTDESLRCQREAATLDPSRLKIYIAGLSAAGRGEEALKEARRVLAGEMGDLPLGFVCLNTLTRFSRDKDEIARVQARLLASLPTDVSGAQWRARLYRARQALDYALAEFNVAVAHAPSDQTLLRERAAVAHLLGHWGRDAKALHEGRDAARAMPELTKGIEQADALLGSFGGSLAEAACGPGRFSHVRTPESVFDLVAGSAPRAKRAARGTGLAMIAHSLTAGGAERIIAGSFRHLRAGGRFDKVDLYLFNLSHEDGTDFYLPLTGLAPEEVVLISRDCEPKAPFSFLPRDVARTCQAIHDRLVADRPAIVHASLEPLTLHAGLAALQAGVPRIVLHTHNMRPTDLHPDSPAPPRWRGCYGALLGRPEVTLVGCAEASVRDYADWIGLKDTSNLEVVYNGLDFEQFKPAADPGAAAALRAGLGFEAEAAVIGTAFKFREEKRPLLWAEAALKVLEQRPDARFVMFGDGPLLEPTRAFVAGRGAADKFALPGLVKDLYNWLPMLDVFMLSSKSEALPNVLIEAQAAGVPVVSRHVGGIAETMIAGETGLLVEEDGADALARALLVAIGDGKWRARAAARGPAFVRERFDTAKMIDALSAIMLR